MNERRGWWCGVSRGMAGWNEAWKGHRPGSTAAPWHWHKLLAQSGRVWDLWELLWVRGRELRLSQKANPWPGHGGGRQSFSEAISISLCLFRLVPGARRHTQGAVSLDGFTLMSVKSEEPPFQHRTAPQDLEIGAVPALHLEKTVDGQQGLMR